MATYLEIAAIIANDTFLKRLQVAIWKKARAILLDSGSTANAKTWARGALGGQLESDKMRRVAIVVASGISSSVNLVDVTDAQIQTAVDAVVTELF